MHNWKVINLYHGSGLHVVAVDNIIFALLVRHWIWRHARHTDSDTDTTENVRRKCHKKYVEIYEKWIGSANAQHHIWFARSMLPVATHTDRGQRFNWTHDFLKLCTSFSGPLVFVRSDIGNCDATKAQAYEFIINYSNFRMYPVRCVLFDMFSWLHDKCCGILTMRRRSGKPSAIERAHKRFNNFMLLLSMGQQHTCINVPAQLRNGPNECVAWCLGPISLFVHVQNGTMRKTLCEPCHLYLSHKMTNKLKKRCDKMGQLNTPSRQRRSI